MSDTRHILQLKDAELASIEHTGSDVTLNFSRVFLIQEMEGAIEDSLWTQAIRLVLRDAEVHGPLPACPCTLSGGDLVNNIFTWRNHAPLPVSWRGNVSCRLQPADSGTPLSIDAGSLHIEQIDHPRYIRHIRKGE